MSAICVYDFRVSAAGDNAPDVTAVRKFLIPLCKKWTFQMEKGEQNGYLHWQGRFSLRAPKRDKWMKARVFKAFAAEGVSHYVAPTSTQNKGNDFYVLKEDTRVEGPFTDKDDEPRYVQRRYQGVPGIRPWQIECLEILDDWESKKNERQVLLIWNRPGDEGKSWLTNYMIQVLGFKFLPPTLPKPNDWIRGIMNQTHPGQICKIVIDVPRAMHRGNWWNIAQAVEQIKQGTVYDERNRWRWHTIEVPQIIIFTNKLPPQSVMSKGVFIVKKLLGGDLGPVTFEDMKYDREEEKKDRIQDAIDAAL